ncbi:MAG: phosphoribosylanthranilate isomerase [Planctomycetota bacterium]
MRTRIKICGVRDAEAARVVAECGGDAVGFVFVEGSPRSIEPEAAAEILLDLPLFLWSVGLMVNPTEDLFEEVIETCPTTHTQLQGTESGSFVESVGPNIIKAVAFDEKRVENDLKRWSSADGVDAVLVDGSAGGQGVAFDWSKLAAVRGACSKPLIVAGGLTPDNVGEAVRAVRPFAVDVSSGVESSRGVKDPELIAAFCDAVRRADG